MGGIDTLVLRQFKNNRINWTVNLIKDGIEKIIKLNVTG